MTESPDTLPDGVRWGSLLAVVGVVIAALSIVLAFVGVNEINPMYWIAILLAVTGVVGAAIRGAQSGTIRYPGGVISTMVGVLVLGYGVETGRLLVVVIGAVILFVGVLGVVLDTRRIE